MFGSHIEHVLPLSSFPGRCPTLDFMSVFGADASSVWIHQLNAKDKQVDRRTESNRPSPPPPAGRNNETTHINAVNRKLARVCCILYHGRCI